jgi:hypothetical protein
MAKNIPTSSIARHSRIYPNLDFGYENMPSGNPGRNRVASFYRIFLCVVLLSTHFFVSLKLPWPEFTLERHSIKIPISFHFERFFPWQT